MYNPWHASLHVLEEMKKKTVEENPGLKICINDYLGGQQGFEEWLKTYIGTYKTTSWRTCLRISSASIQLYLASVPGLKKQPIEDLLSGYL